MTDQRVLKADNALLALRRRLARKQEDLPAQTTYQRQTRLLRRIDDARYNLQKGDRSSLGHAIREINHARRVPIKEADAVELIIAGRELENVERDL